MKLSTLIKSLPNIISGILNWLFHDSHIENIAEKRMSTCRKCVYFDKIGTTCFIPGSAPCCEVCGCKLAWLTRDLASECHKGYWLAESDNNTDTATA